MLKVVTKKTLLKWNQRHLAQSTEHRVQSTECRVQSAAYRLQSAEYRVHSTVYRAQSTEHRALILLVILVVDKMQIMQHGNFDELWTERACCLIHDDEMKKGKKFAMFVEINSKNKQDPA